MMVKQTERMMKKSFMMVMGILTLWLTLMVSSSVFAQDALSYSWGTVVEVSKDQIILDEYDYEKETYVNVPYIVSADIVIENAASLADVKPGEEVEVGFILQDLDKVAMTLYIEKDVPVEDEFSD